MSPNTPRRLQKSRKEGRDEIGAREQPADALSGHAQDVPLRYSIVSDSSNVLKEHQPVALETLWQIAAEAAPANGCQVSDNLNPGT
jgi:hypothetical protein